MALTFPATSASPWTDPNGVVWTWNGYAWGRETGGGGNFTAPAGTGVVLWVDDDTAGNAIANDPANAAYGFLLASVFDANATVPSAPLNPVAYAGSGQATVTFDPPADNGGSSVTQYTVTSSPGNISATGTNSPIVVPGLTDTVAYTFTVRATNSAGTSAFSAASNSVTPVAAITYDVLALPGLAGWYDAADDAAFTLSGDDVTQWRDKSANAWHRNNYLGMNAPSRTVTLGGRKVLSFATANSEGLVADYGANSINFDTGYMIYMVCRIQNLANYGIMLGFRMAGDDGDGNHASHTRFNGTVSFRHNVGVNLNSSIAYNSWGIISAYADAANGIAINTNNGNATPTAHNGTLVAVRYNSVGMGFSSSTVIPPVTSSTGFEGDIAEQIICTSVHDTAKRAEVVGYLADKWGITL